MSLFKNPFSSNKKEDQIKKKIYDIVPQMAAYHSFAHLWVPTVMHMTPPNFRSDTVNTDSTGMRWTFGKNHRMITPESIKTEACNIIVGGSTPFGVGATSDSATIASKLSLLSSDNWINFAIRTHTLTQNLSFFLSHRHRLTRIRSLSRPAADNNPPATD